MTLAERIKQEGIEQGIEQGIGQGIEQGIGQGIEQGIGQGIEQNSLAIAKKLLATGTDPKFVAHITDLALETVYALQSSDKDA